MHEAKTGRIERRDKTRITLGDFNTWQPIIDKTAKQKISKDIEELNNTFTNLI